MSTLLSCRSLVCRLRGQLVLQDAGFEVAAGESLALLGSSGSGKSTLLRIIAGLEIPERGEVVVGGRLATRDGRLLIAPHRRGLAMLFQDLALWPNLSVSENVRLGLSRLHLSRRELDDRLHEAMKISRIEELSDRLPGTLSGGQQQRLALARALAMRPKLLLLDEPLGGLDLVTKQLVVREIVRLRSELGFALIVVTHDPMEVCQLCDALAVLANGRIEERRQLRNAAASARTPLAKAFIQQLQKMT